MLNTFFSNPFSPHHKVLRTGLTGCFSIAVTPCRSFSCRYAGNNNGVGYTCFSRGGVRVPEVVKVVNSPANIFRTRFNVLISFRTNNSHVLFVVSYRCVLISCARHRYYVYEGYKRYDNNEFPAEVTKHFLPVHECSFAFGASRVGRQSNTH